MPGSKEDAESQQTSTQRPEVEEPSQLELLRREYALHSDLYKFHLESTIKLLVLMFAVTGAMLGYYNNLQATNDLRKFLLVPACAMNLIVGFAFLMAARGVPARQREVIGIAKRLGFQSPLNGRFHRRCAGHSVYRPKVL